MQAAAAVFELCSYLIWTQLFAAVQHLCICIVIHKQCSFMFSSARIFSATKVHQTSLRIRIPKGVTAPSVCLTACPEFMDITKYCASSRKMLYPAFTAAIFSCFSRSQHCLIWDLIWEIMWWAINFHFIFTNFHLAKDFVFSPEWSRLLRICSDKVQYDQRVLTSNQCFPTML